MKSKKLTSISDEMVIGAPTIEEILPDFLKFCEGCGLIAHNASFDVGFIEENCRRMEYSYRFYGRRYSGYGKTSSAGP